MSEARIFVEGEGNLCREGFTSLLTKAGLRGRVPRIVACGARNRAYEQFRKHHLDGKPAFLIVDSEDPVTAPEKTWDHLKQRDKWDCPTGATDKQVFFMMTCMETWIISDRDALKRHYGQLQESALPNSTPTDLESIPRDKMLKALENATRTCSNAYKKGRRSYSVFSEIIPENLPAFQRMRDILKEALQ